MRVIRGLYNLRPEHRGCVLSIGNFDGMHLGHQKILDELRERAARRNLASMVMTFEPKPLEFFDPQHAPARLASLRETIQDMAALELGRLLCVRFDQRFADLSPQAFVEELLVKQLGVAEVMVGEDFRYGCQRAGNLSSLRKQGEAHGFSVVPMPTVMYDGERVSSTRVRAALGQGKPALAENLLGRAYKISGRVAHGAQLGRTLNVPTANIALHRKPAPQYGVYAVNAQLADGRCLPGAANLGVRPTVDGKQCLLEVHLLDFNEDIYGQRLNVYFREFLRPELRFEDTQALRTQMLADIEQARVLLKED